MTRAAVGAVVFDLGGVLIDWDPRRVYRPLFGGDERRVEWFLANVCNSEWNARMDAGESFASCIADFADRFPDWADAIGAYRTRWTEMIGGRVPGTAAIVERLEAQGVALFALSNWSLETFPLVHDDYPELGRFQRIFLSGAIGVAKPDRRIFEFAFDAIGLPAEQLVFIDDNAANITAAKALGMQAIAFTSAVRLEADLKALGVLA